MKLQDVKVIWADAHSDSAGWTGVKDHVDEGEYLVHTMGWLLTDADGGKPGHVSVCQSYTPDEDVDHILHIPQAMVRHLDFMMYSHSEQLGYGHGRQET